jgi:hypothetical protein
MTNNGGNVSTGAFAGVSLKQGLDRVQVRGKGMRCYVACRRMHQSRPIRVTESMIQAHTLIPHIMDISTSTCELDEKDPQDWTVQGVANWFKE